MQLDEKILAEISPRFKETDDITEYNQLKMLSAFIKNGVTESAFAGSTGYGYDDRGREILERVMADAMGAEDSLIRHNFVSGTHTLTVALFGLLRPGDKVLVLTGRPYDTITGVFGIDEKTDGSLADFGVEYNKKGACRQYLQNGIHSALARVQHKAQPYNRENTRAVRYSARGLPQKHYNGG